VKYKYAKLKNNDIEVVATQNSANGRTSHLMYLLKIDESTKVGVFETAVGKPGDITNACHYFKPSIGVITNIGIHHLDECKTLEGYIFAKAELVNGLNNQGLLIINKDDDIDQKINLTDYKGRIITFGVDQKSTYQGSDITYEVNGMNFKLVYTFEEYEVFVPGYGIHQVYNALATIACCHELGLRFIDIIDQLKTYKKLPLRLELKQGLNNCTILNDTWNVTTTSLISALQTFHHLARDKKKVVLIGEIHKTGDVTDMVIEHYRDILIQYGCINTLIAVGNTSEKLIHEIEKKGFLAKTYHFNHYEEVVPLLKEILDEHTYLLLKMTIEDSPHFINQILLENS